MAEGVYIITGTGNFAEFFPKIPLGVQTLTNKTFSAGQVTIGLYVLTAHNNKAAFRHPFFNFFKHFRIKFFDPFIYQSRRTNEFELGIFIHTVQRTANEEGFAVLRAEMYGHGKSGGAFGDHTLMKWISNILTVIDYARTLDFVSDLYLCGHSQGGLLTMLAGAMERDRLKAILPLSPASMIPEIARQGEILGVPFDPTYYTDYLTKKFSALYEL